MAQAYTPALQAAERLRVRKLRELPLPGTSLVKVGDRVTAMQSVLSAELPGELIIVRIADRMGVEVEDAAKGMRVAVGDKVEKGEELSSVKSFFGLFTASLASPTQGTVEFFTEANAHIGIRQASVPLAVDAYVDGNVVEVDEGKSVVIETEAVFVQGIFGIGGERQGEIYLLDVLPEETVSASLLETKRAELKGKVVVGGAAYSKEALDLAAEAGVAAVVCGSIDSETLAHFVGYQIGVSITGDEDVPFTLIVSEGFGQLAFSSRVSELLSAYVGKTASVNGATQVRAGAMRPEIIIPLEQSPQSESVLAEEDAEKKLLEIGARLRIIRVPYFGRFGVVTELPHEPHVVPSGARVRVLRAKLEGGEEVVVPRANVELV